MENINNLEGMEKVGGFLNTWTVIIAVIVVLVIWVIGVYNKFIKLLIRVDEAWSNIEVQLKRRYDLIPNLVEIVKGYATHERETLDAVISARNKAAEINIDAKNMTPELVNTFMQAQDGLAGALKNLFALSESYPDLKANQNFLELQRQLEDTEDKIESSRAGYNGAVREYNIQIRLVPSNIVAKMFNFTEREMFEVENEVEREAVQVKF